MGNQLNEGVCLGACHLTHTVSTGFTKPGAFWDLHSFLSKINDSMIFHRI